MPTLLDKILGREANDPTIPDCPVHHVEMHLRGKQGRPTRFADQHEQEYTLIYFCPVSECNETATRIQKRTQIPVPGASPERPLFSRVRDPR